MPLRFRKRSLCVLFLVALPGGNAQEEAEVLPLPATTVAIQTALPPGLTSLFPIGREFQGVSIPSYSNDVLKSVMRADSVIRVDEQYLDLVNLVISVYNGEDEVEAVIRMDEAAYDLLIGELTSKTPATIEQPRFTMTGDKMIFDTRSQVSRLVGNVRVIVPEAGKMAPSIGIPLPGGR